MTGSRLIRNSVLRYVAFVVLGIGLILIVAGLVSPFKERTAIGYNGNVIQCGSAWNSDGEDWGPDPGDAFPIDPDNLVESYSRHAEASIPRGMHNAGVCASARADTLSPIVPAMGVGLVVVSLVFLGRDRLRSVMRPDGAQSTPQSLPIRGWYPDPNNPKLERWFNGNNWTRGTRPR